MTPLPANGVSSPIVVGDKIFLTSEVSDLICLEKKTGRVLWIRSNPEFEGISEEERRGNPDFAEKLAPLSAELAEVNEKVVAALNAQSTTASAVAQRGTEAVFKKKREIEKQIEKTQLAIDKKRFERYWGQCLRCRSHCC